MRTLDIYIGKTILGYCLLVFGVLLGLFTFVNFIDELADLGTGQYSMVEIIKYVVLTMPRSIYEIFPMAALLGTVLGLSVMAQDAELTVMRAVGVSLNRIAYSVLKMGMILAIIAMIIGELILPKSDTLAEHNRNIALQKQTKQQTKLGTWVKDGQAFVNVKEVLPDLTLIDVQLFEFDEDKRMRSMVEADKATYQKDQGWALEGIKQTIFDNDITNIQQIKANEANWATLLTPEILSVFLIKPDQMAAWDLYNYTQHLKKNQQDTGSYDLEFWAKIMLPISTTIMMLVAIPFVFSQTRSGNLGVSLFGGIMLGICFHILSKGFGYFVLAYGIPPFIGAVLPTLCFLLIAIWLMSRVR